MWRSLLIFLSFYLYSIVDGYPNGAGTCSIDASFSSVTGSMPPNQYPRNTNAGAYSITANVTQYSPGQPISITLSLTGSSSIDGFLITPYQGTTSNYVTIGSWTKLGTRVQLASSAGTSPTGTCTNAITHTSPVGATSVNAVFTPGNTGFFWSSGTPSLVPGSANFTISVAMAMPGTVYYVFLLSGSTAPSATQVIAGQDSTNTHQPSGSITVSNSNTTYKAGVSLASATTYDGYFVGQYSVGNPSLTFAAYILDTNGLNFFRLVSGSGAISIPAVSPNVQSTVKLVSGITLSNIALVPQNITFSPISSVTYGDTDATLTATATSGYPVTFTSSNSSICSVSDNTVHFAGAGTAIITAYQVGGGNFSAAPTVDQNCIVGRASQTIMVTNPPYNVLIQGSSVRMVGYTSSVGLPLSYSLNPSNTKVASVSNDIVTGLTPGSVTVVISSNGGTNYAVASTNFILNVTAIPTVPTGATQVFLQLNGLSIQNATKDLTKTQTQLQDLLASTLNIPANRVSLSYVQALVSDPTNSVQITFNLLPSAAASDPTPDALLTSIQTAAANSSSSFSQAVQAQGWNVVQVTTTLPYSIQFKGQNLFFATKASGLPDNFEAYWTITGSQILMAVRAKTAGWLGWGFSPGSTAQMIGSDAAIGWDGLTYSYINDYHLIDKTQGASLNDGGQQGLSRAEVDYDGSLTTILFQRNLIANGTSIKASGNTPVVFAVGPLPPANATSIIEHSDKYAGNVNFASGDYASQKDPEKQAHAALMWLGFGFFLPLGIITARFLKPYHPPLWFHLHRGFQLFGLALIFSGFIIGAAVIGGHDEKDHMGFGYAAISLAILNPVIALIRPHHEQGHPATTPRQIWFATHAIVGYSAVILAWINMFIGIAILQTSSAYLGCLIASIIIWALMWIIGSILKLRSADSYDKPKEMTMT